MGSSRLSSMNWRPTSHDRGNAGEDTGPVSIGSFVSAIHFHNRESSQRSTSVISVLPARLTCSKGAAAARRCAYQVRRAKTHAGFPLWRVGSAPPAAALPRRYRTLRRNCKGRANTTHSKSSGNGRPEWRSANLRLTIRGPHWRPPVALRFIVGATSQLRAVLPRPVTGTSPVADA
jgi:hypothetical protein